jgi:phosphate starvation-inducible PhoH-like protein
MARKSPRNNNSLNQSAGKMRRRKPINSDWMTRVDPITFNQRRIFEAFDSGKNLFIHGCPGTGKTYLALYLSLREALKEYSDIEHVYIVRSLVATREIGFLPGTLEEKSEQYLQYYGGQVKSMFDIDNVELHDMILGKLQEQDTIRFITTSFLRGATFNNSIIIVDEASNLNGHELSSIVTRVGDNSRIIFCGDYFQSDLRKHEREGWQRFINVLSEMPEYFSIIEMEPSDIVRSELVRKFIETQIRLGYIFN